MKRRQLFELNEIDWVPARLKALATDYLRTLVEVMEPFSPQLPLIAQALRHTGEGNGVIDLCAGGGGPWRHLSPQLNRLAGRPVPVLHTDKYPSVSAAELPEGPPDVAWHMTPLDATAVPESLPGMRTLFNGFHQFTPETATTILRDAVEHREPVVVMELLQRRYPDLLLVACTPLLVWLLTPWIRPFSWLRLALTYVLPVAPIMITWETLASLLRCYTPGELRAMGEAAGGDAYLWFADSYRYRGAPVTFVIGYPREDGGAG